VHGDNDKAAATFREIAGERPDLPELNGLVAQAFLQKKDYASAREWIRKWIDVHPQDGAGYQRLAEIYKAEGKPEGVIPELEKYAKEHPDNLVLAFQLAASYESAGRKDEAVGILRKLSIGTDKTQGTSVAAAMKLAEMELAADRPAAALEALGIAMSVGVAESQILIRGAQIIDGLKDPARVYQDFQKLLTDDQKNYGLFILGGMLSENLKRRDEALVLYDKALARQPRAAIAYSRKADLLIEANRHADALAVYQAAEKAGLDLPIFHRKMGMLLEFLDQPKEAIEQYRLTRQAAPDDKATRYLLAGLLARTGQADEAEKEFKSLIARFPGEVQAFCQLGGLYMARSQMEAAEKAVADAQAADANAVLPKALLAEIRFRQKKLEEAEKITRGILAEHPTENDVRLLQAYILAAQKRLPEAAAELKVLLAADPENINWRYFLAGLDSERGDTAAAEQELSRILQKKPLHAPSANDLGYMWADRGINLVQAEKLIRDALQASPKNAAYMDSLGWAMYKQGRFEEAVKTLLEATAISPEMDPILWDHLGDAYWRLSRRDDAVKAWETAAKLLAARAADVRPADVQRVQSKMQSIQAGKAPEVAPVAPAEIHTQPGPSTSTQR
jgi:tetratricopeptide (TPR) repeat protein